MLVAQPVIDRAREELAPGVRNQPKTNGENPSASDSESGYETHRCNYISSAGAELPAQLRFNV